MKQIQDEKNNFSIVEKINQLKNLIKCMKNKVYIIERVEMKRKQAKALINGNGTCNSILIVLDGNNASMRTFNIVLKRNDENDYEMTE